MAGPVKHAYFCGRLSHHLPAVRRAVLLTMYTPPRSAHNVHPTPLVSCFEGKLFVC